MGSIAGGLYSLFGPNPVAKAAANAGQNEFTAEGQAVGGITSALNTGSTAVNNALAGGTAAVNEAGQNINTATTGANDTLQGFLNTLNQNTAPGVASGIQGNTQLQQYAASNPQFNFAPTQQQLEQTPGYQFQLQQGTNAIQNNAAAQGLSQGGGTLAALTQYGQGLAGTYYQNAFNNALQGFQTNQNTTLNNLQALIGSGNTANTQQLAATSALGAPQASNTISAANENAGLQQFLANLNTSGQENLAGLGLQGAETQGNDIINTVTNAGNFGLIGAGAKAAQNNGAIGNIIGGIPGLLGAFGL